MTRDVGRRLGLGLVALVLLCGLSESVARGAGAPQAYTAIYRYDDLLGYRYITAQVVEFAVGAERYRVEFDGDGVVDRAGRRPEAIVILGDGVVAGLELPREQRIAARVELASQRGAVSLAVPGYWLLQEVLGLERWLSKHERPGTVVVVQNFANDLIDNVPEWEGVAALPGVRNRGPSGLELIPPRLPSAPYRWLSSVAKASHLYGIYEASRPRAAEPALTSRQQWLYATEPPPQLEHGLEALRWSGRRLHALADRYQFSVVVVDWVDWPLLWPVVDEPVARQRLASTRVQQAIGFPSRPVAALVPDSAQVAGWSSRWLIESTRHANAEAVSALSRAIVDRLESGHE